MLKKALVLAWACSLAGCATARLHDEVALNAVALGCGLSYGELIQDASEKRLLIAMKFDIDRDQRACVSAWAKRNHLTPVFVQIDQSAS